MRLMQSLHYRKWSWCFSRSPIQERESPLSLHREGFSAFVVQGPRQTAAFRNRACRNPTRLITGRMPTYTITCLKEGDYLAECGTVRIRAFQCRDLNIKQQAKENAGNLLGPTSLLLQGQSSHCDGRRLRRGWHRKRPSHCHHASGQGHQHYMSRPQPRVGD